MWSIVSSFVWLVACSTPEPPAKPVAPVAAQKAAKQKGAPKGAKTAKGGKSAKGQPAGAKAAGAKAKAAPKAPAPKPIGAPGPVVGELKLAAAAPAAPAGADAAPGPAKTEASLALGFADGQTTTVALGAVEGTCAEIAPVPVGPAGKQKTPTWSVKCTDGGASSEVYVLQLGKTVTVVKATPDPAGAAAPKFRIVKRVPLVDGATLERKPQG